MENIDMLSDTEITKRISEKLKELRLKQNITRQDVSISSGVSMSSIVRMEDGEIKSFESFLRILRTLGRIDILRPLLEEEEISPNEYYKLMHSAKAKQRKRASKSNTNNKQKESEW
ncbi:MAG: helix-turn-helix domain-containing protein [Bacteroidales bacterium]|nr:helix-turn-helix domain-containing protein [Bacteroidales bacterium]